MNLTARELIEKYPFLKAIIDNTLIVSEDEIKENKKGIKVKYIVNGNLELATATLLLKLLTDDRYYEYVKKLFNDEIDEIGISAIDNGDILPRVTFTKMEIVKGIEGLLESTDYIYDEEFYTRFNSLKEKTFFDKFVDKYSSLAYQINIDGNEVIIPFINMINFLKLPDEFYNKCMNLEYLSKVKKEYFIYALLKFIEEDKILSSYDFDIDIIRRIARLKFCEAVDIQALNVLTKTETPVSEQITLNRELHDEILRDMPEYLSDIEKAVYIYIKMCKTLTYDEEFYIEGQTGYVLDNHNEIISIPKITPKNNKVVCFEFTTMYAKILSELGINYEIYEKGIHSGLTFRCGKFIIGADSVVSILRGDLFQAKLNLSLNGLKSKNMNEKTKEEFNTIIQKIYKIMSNDVNINHEEKFIDMVREYRKTTNITPVSLLEKISILIGKIKNAKFDNVDSLSYILHMHSIIFTLKERTNNVCINIIKRKTSDCKHKANVIFTINESDIELEPNKNTYLCYDLNGNFIELNREQIKRMFETGTFSYIYRDSHKIPGIKNREEVLYERTNRTK